MSTVFCIQTIRKTTTLTISILAILAAGILMPQFAKDNSLMGSVEAHPPRVVDDADILTADEEADLQYLADEISERQQFDVVIVTINSLNGEDIQYYAADYYDYGGYGMGENYDGVMFLISMEEREWFILTTGYAIDVLNDSDIDTLGDEIVPYLSSGDYAEGFRIFAESCEEEVIYTNENGVEEAKPSLLISVIAGLVLGLIPAFIMRGKLKTVHMQKSAVRYEKRETRNITVRQDTFLYHTINRTPIETDSGTRSGGSSTFTGSSGRSHGGGGGGF